MTALSTAPPPVPSCYILLHESALACWQQLGIRPPKILEPQPILSLPILAMRARVEAAAIFS